MPETAGEWKTRKLKFKDRPDETYTIRHRDPVEAIKNLWKDPGLSPEMQFKPQKIYTDARKDTRIYNEMWTGQWWHVLQVCLYMHDIPYAYIILTYHIEQTSNRWHFGPCDYFYRQNSAYTILWRQSCLSSLSNYWQYSKSYKM